MRRIGTDEGSVLLLGIGWLFTCLVAVVVMIDISAIMLQRQHLQAASDAAALAGAQGIDLAAYYSQGATINTRLDAGSVRARVLRHLEASDTYADLPGLTVDRIWTDGEHVQVSLRKPLVVPILPTLVDVEVSDAVVESWSRLSQV